MFDRLRKVLSGESSALAESVASNADVARWAASQEFVCALHAEGNFQLTDALHGFDWQMDSAPSDREYIRGQQLRGRADVGADPDTSIMVITRPLREALEGKAYASITDSLQTSVDSRLPEEMRWLSLYDEVVWPGLPGSFRQQFAVIADRQDLAQRWISAAVVSQLMDVLEGQGAAGNQTPIVLMMARGNVYLRTERYRKSLPEVVLATRAFLTAGASARALRLPAEPSLDG